MTSSLTPEQQLADVLDRYGVPEWITDDMGRNMRRADLIATVTDDAREAGYEAGYAEGFDEGVHEGKAAGS